MPHIQSKIECRAFFILRQLRAVADSMLQVNDDRFIQVYDNSVIVKTNEQCYTEITAVFLLPLSEFSNLRNSLGEHPRICLNRREKYDALL